MSEPQMEEVQLSSRKKRVQRLKRIIIITMIISILFPIILSIFLLIKTIRLEKEIEELKQMMTLETTSESIVDRKETMEEIEALQIEVSGIELQMELEEEGSETATENESTEEENTEEVNSEGDNTEEENTEQVKMRNVYLTFDDGPSIYTDEILDILNEYNVKATFFVVGKEGEKYETLYRRIVEEGHTLGMHSYSHRYDEIYASVENFAEDFEKLRTYLYDITGVQSRFYRFPGGSSNTVSEIDMSYFIDYLEEQDIVFFDWNVSSGDSASGGISAEQIIDNCTGNVDYYNSMVILMHDSQEKRSTVDALPSVIEKLLAYENTQIVPITDDTEPVQHRKK